MHIHFATPDGTAKFWLEPIVALANFYNLRTKDLRNYVILKQLSRSTKMSSNLPGIDISHSEVTNIGPHGFWLLVDDREYLVPFADYPAFQQATVAQIYTVQRLSPDQFHWPDLDVDIELESLEHPGQFPLTFQA